ncbi:hypothetical protein J1605_020599 [Eschrichtius robustus]|uniref:Uncharacterized protein n=1 Tax=Eschrichtius robustus TaxID=9764 RepID=A0AB34HJX5_ESCRO|nr:hypothetical protein J1605_020599 [Eschrichtius robustus]
MGEGTRGHGQCHVCPEAPGHRPGACKLQTDTRKFTCLTVPSAYESLEPREVTLSDVSQCLVGPHRMCWPSPDVDDVTPRDDAGLLPAQQPGHAVTVQQQGAVVLC